MSNKVILLVENNPDDEQLTLRALEKNNILCNVVVARDGAEALDFFFCTGIHSGRDAGVMPTVVLLDLKMPKLDGFEVLRRLRADHRTARIPVVLLSSSGQDQDLMEGYRWGANSYIRKPVDFEEFAEAIRQLAVYWLVLNKTA